MAERPRTATWTLHVKARLSVHYSTLAILSRIRFPKIALLVLLISCDDLALILDSIFPREGGHVAASNRRARSKPMCRLLLLLRSQRRTVLLRRSHCRAFLLALLRLLCLLLLLRLLLNGLAHFRHRWLFFSPPSSGFLHPRLKSIHIWMTPGGCEELLPTGTRTSSSEPPGHARQVLEASSSGPPGPVRHV